MKIMKKIISVFAALTLAVTVPAQVFAVSGTSAQSGKDQLTISDTEGFLKFAEDCRLDSYSSNLYVTLTADIELSGEYTPVPVFGGVFDGAGHTVSGVTMTADGSNVGLFRYVQRGALVKDLTVEGNISPSGSGENVGGIAGMAAAFREACEQLRQHHRVRRLWLHQGNHQRRRYRRLQREERTYRQQQHLRRHHRLPRYRWNFRHQLRHDTQLHQQVERQHHRQ